MSLPIFFLIILSCALHAGWNILGKTSKGSSFSFSFATSFFIALLLAPYLFWFLKTVGLHAFPKHFWLLIVLTGISQTVYLIGLINAYKHADVSVIYPVARSLPVLIVGVICSLTGLALTGWQWLGFSLVTMGCLLIPLTTFSSLTFTDYLRRGFLCAIVAASGTTAYTMIDKTGLDIASNAVEDLVTKSHTSIFYLGCQAWSTATAIWLFALLRGKAIQFAAVWSIRYQAGLAGVMMAVTYGLVLLAMTMTENVSLLVALRQLSIVFGVFMGVCILKEPWYLTRGIGVCTILLGLVMAFHQVIYRI